MQCYIYKSTKKQDFYLYVPEKGQFASVPPKLLERLGSLEFLFDLDLDKRQKLATVDPKSVIDNILDNGYYLQIPPKLF